MKTPTIAKLLRPWCVGILERETTGRSRAPRTLARRAGILVAALSVGVLVAACSDNDTSSGDSGPASPNGFRKLMMPTFSHPRCVNCHDFNAGSPTAISHQGRSSRCIDCHSTVPSWEAPPASFSFTGVSSEDICRGIKTKFAGDIQMLRAHLISSPRLEWGITNAHIAQTNTFLEPAPPADVQVWISLVNRWVNNGAVCD